MSFPTVCQELKLTPIWGRFKSIRLCKGEGKSWGNAVREEEVTGREIKWTGTLHKGPSLINGNLTVQPMQAGSIISELEKVVTLINREDVMKAVEKDKTPKHPSPRRYLGGRRRSN